MEHAEIVPRTVAAIRLVTRRPTNPGHCILSDSQWSAVGANLRLSGRELQIVRCIFDDQKELAIADTLDISTHTVHNHVARLYHKLHVTSRVELVIRVMAVRAAESPV